jgi:hypothetical protein
MKLIAKNDHEMCFATYGTASAATPQNVYQKLKIVLGGKKTNFKNGPFPSCSAIRGVSFIISKRLDAAYNISY